MVRKTSAEAYKVIVENGILSERFKDVWEVHFRHGNIGKREMFEIYKKEHPGTKVQVDSFGPRYAPMVAHGVLRETGEKICPYTGQTVMTWDVTTHVPSTGIKSGKSKNARLREWLLVNAEHYAGKQMDIGTSIRKVLKKMDELGM